MNTGKIYGYHRVSTEQQHLDRGEAEIRGYCDEHGLKLEKIFVDKRTGKDFNRPWYVIMRDDVLREGDTLIVTELDRLGRTRRDTLKEIHGLQDKGVRIMVLEIPTTLTDLSRLDSSTNKLFQDMMNGMMIEMYTTFAQVELEKKEKRQREGIEAMKARGEWDRYGRPKAMEYEEFARAYARVSNGEVKPFELMRELGLTKSTFYRLKKQYDEQEKPCPC